MAQQNKSQSKVKTGLARCLELASGHKGLVFLSGVLAALAAICSFVPYLLIYYIIREILFVYPDMSLLNVSTISTWGWLALAGILGNIVFYFFALLCSHIAAFGTLYELKVAFADHIMQIPLGYHLTLGSGTFIDGFEDQIVGHMPGETFDVNVTFPDDYQATNLAGKDAVFATTLNYINEDVTPDLTDDWVSSNLAESMGMNNVAELKTFVSNSLLFNQEANELYGQLYDAAEVNTDTLPEDVQQYFTNTVLYQPYLYAQMRGVSLETMLSQAGYSSVDEYLENSESSKQSMIKQILIMQALAEKNNIVCDTDILNAEFSRYFGSTDMTSYVNAYGENYVKTNILHDIVMQNQIDNVA